MSKREPGPDLLRCVAFLFVVTYHSFLFNGFFYQPQTGTAMWLANSTRYLSACCNGIFMMLTGYLKCENTDFKSSCRSLVPVLLGYFLAAVVSIPIRHFAFSDVQPLSVWVSRLFGFGGCYYGWYVEMYIGLALLSPFVNMVLKKLEESKRLLLFAFVMLMLTAFPGATPWGILPDYWQGLYPLTYYVLGAVVRKCEPKIPSWAGILGALMVALILGGVTLLSTDGDFRDGINWDFEAVWIVLIAVCLFLSLYRLRIPAVLARLLRFGAGGCFGGYLLSHLLDGWCYRLIPQWHTPVSYLLIFLCITLPIFVLSMLGGKLLQKLTQRLLSVKSKTKA